MPLVASRCWPFALVAALALLAGCKDDPPSPAATEGTAAAAVPTPNVAKPLPTPSVSAAPSAVPSASALAAGPSPSAAPSGSAKGPATCGDKPLPPCPLAAWMKANTSPAMSAQDFGALAKALDKIATLAPPAYPNWASISHDGADAARAESLDAVKASCRGCHNQYKDRYKKEMRDRPVAL